MVQAISGSSEDIRAVVRVNITYDTHRHSLPSNASSRSRSQTCLYLSSTLFNFKANSYQGNYNIDVVASEPDPHVVDLNAELATCDDYASVTLPPKERRYALTASTRGFIKLYQGSSSRALAT